MKVLSSDNLPFDLNQPTHKLIDTKMCVFDTSDKNYKDFFFKKITNYISYRYPSVMLKLYNEKTSFNITLPLNWKIATLNESDFLCDIVSLEELVHFEHTVPVFNPLHVGIPNLMKIKITGINPIMTEHFVPKLPKKNMLVLPLGDEKQYHKVIEHGEEKLYPPCFLAYDDCDSSKITCDYYADIVGD